MDHIILGDNQFFGVNHMSEERGMRKLIEFQDINSIIKVIETAYDCGIHAFSFSTHDRVSLICDHFRANPNKFADLKLYPVLPYAHKYANLVNEKGILGTLKELLFKDSSAKQLANMLIKGGSVIIKQNPIEIMKLLIDMEMKMFRGLTIKVIFLQNIVTDLLLGSKIKEIFQSFIEYIEMEYKVRAGFMTMNMPMMVNLLLEIGIKDPIVCSAINKVGFQMNPDRKTCEETLKSKSFTSFAMSPMAAGAVSPKEAFEYISSLKNVKSIIFGASSKRNIKQTKEIIDHLYRD